MNTTLHALYICTFLRLALFDALLRFPGLRAAVVHLMHRHIARIRRRALLCHQPEGKEDSR
jgi:hypothetical protein